MTAPLSIAPRSFGRKALTGSASFEGKWTSTRGSSYVLSDLLAAFLSGQLEARADIQAARRRIWLAYEQALASWADTVGAQLPHVPEQCEQPYHMFYVVLPSEDMRHRLIDHLRDRGILAVFHYLPLHLSAMGRRLGGQPGQCPVSESVSDRLLRLPFFTTMSETEQEEVIAAVLAFRG
jgi:dTDP-4-amino-4,6-dideoxygalactose transaminase